MIDTVEFCGNTNYAEDYGQPDESMRNSQKFSEQKDYIEQQLANNKYVTYLLICQSTSKNYKIGINLLYCFNKFLITLTFALLFQKIYKENVMSLI